MLDLRLAPQRRGGHHRALRQFAEARGAAADEGVAHILARQEARHREAGRQLGRHVLHGMHGDVDLARQQRLLDLLGEKALAAGVGERPVLDAVAGGLDGANLERMPPGAVRRLQPLLHFARLGQGQRRAARADADCACLQASFSRC